jgi:hypothetical protein
MKKKATSDSFSQAPQMYQSQGRLFILDLLKAMSMVAVVSYHSILVPKSTYADSALLLDTLFAPLRFCVPVLLTISFMLFERGLNNHSNKPTWSLIKKRLIRLAIPTLFWFSLAAGLKLIKGNSPLDLIGEILTGEIFTGSYYLLVMFQFIPIFIWVRGWLNHPNNILTTLLSQGFVFMGIYAVLCGVFGADIVSILRTINRPLLIYWFVYPALGVYFYKTLSFYIQKSASLSTYVKVLIVFFISSGLIAEYSFLDWLSKGSIPPFDYVMFSCVFSVPAAFLCFGSIQAKELSSFLSKAVILLSKYSLGIFCINGILSQIFLSIGSRWFSAATFSFPEILAIKVIGWVLLLAVSLGLSIGIDRIGGKTVVC